ncbi:hypothetical protein CNMCM8714_004840 [Aspergillus fumigatus]|nr:hypothetical protein CNMCM8714_004840 [Aspergillus fumigatus]
MSVPHYRKIELQSPADFTYLYANTVALSRQKLDLHLPPSANTSDGPDPMRERVKELVKCYPGGVVLKADQGHFVSFLFSISKYR